MRVTAGELLDEVPPRPLKTFRFGDPCGDCRGLVMGRRDSSAMLGMTWVCREWRERGVAGMMGGNGIA